MEEDEPTESTPWDITIPKATFEKLKTDPSFCAIVALARVLNALNFAYQAFMENEEETPAGRRTKINSLLLTTALFAEAKFLIDRIGKHFHNDAHFQKVTTITTSKEARTILDSHLVRVRNKLVFHFDPDEVMTQLKAWNVDEPIFVSGLGKTKLQVHYRLGDAVALRTLVGPDNAGAKETAIFMAQVTELILSFLEAAEEFIVETSKQWIS